MKGSNDMKPDTHIRHGFKNAWAGNGESELPCKNKGWGDGKKEFGMTLVKFETPQRPT